MGAMPRPLSLTLRLGVALTGWILAIVCIGVGAQGSSSSDRPVSSTVVASWLTRGDKLTLLVLWRGTPGWFWRVSGHGGGGGGNGQQAFQQIRYGDRTFKIDYDFSKDTATVEGREFSIRDTNVVMVDFVDSVGGPTIVDTRYVDPILSASRDDGLVVIAREPDLYQFLRCDLSLPPSTGPAAQMQQALVTAVCGQLRPR